MSEQQEEYVTISAAVSLLRQRRGGSIVSEMYHVRDDTQIRLAICMEYDNGILSREIYISKQRGVGRAKYEKERVAFPGMPPSNDKLGEGWETLMKAARKEQREHRRLAKTASNDPGHARKIDEHCEARRKEAVALPPDGRIDQKAVLLGERGAAASERILTKLGLLKCTQIHLGGIETDDDHVGASYLVYALPEDPMLRVKALQYSGRLAAQIGYSGESNCGQRWDFIKLD